MQCLLHFVLLFVNYKSQHILHCDSLWIQLYCFKMLKLNQWLFWILYQYFNSIFIWFKVKHSLRHLFKIQVKICLCLIDLMILNIGIVNCMNMSKKMTFSHFESYIKIVQHSHNSFHCQYSYLILWIVVYIQNQSWCSDFAQQLLFRHCFTLWMFKIIDLYRMSCWLYQTFKSRYHFYDKRGINQKVVISFHHKFQVYIVCCVNLFLNRLNHRSYYNKILKLNHWMYNSRIL